MANTLACLAAYLVAYSIGNDLIERISHLRPLTSCRISSFLHYHLLFGFTH